MLVEVVEEVFEEVEGVVVVMLLWLLEECEMELAGTETEGEVGVLFCSAA